METKQFVTVAVALIVGVILIGSVVTPIISDTLDTGSSENSTKSVKSADAKTFTNEGIAYFDVPKDTTEHTLIVSYTGSAMQFIFDGTTLFEKELGDTEWMVPLIQWINSNTDYHDTYYLVWGLTETNEETQWSLQVAYAHYSNDWPYDDLDLSYYAFPEEINGQNGKFLEFTINYNGVMGAGYAENYTEYGGLDVSDLNDIQWYMSSQGDTVYAQNPVIMESTVVGMCGYTCYKVVNGSSIRDEYYLAVWGESNIPSLTQDRNDMSSKGFYKRNGQGSMSVYGYYDVIDAIPYEGAYRLEKVEATCRGDSFGKDPIVIDMFMVPTVVTVESSDVPVNGYWKMAGDDEFDLYASYNDGYFTISFDDAGESVVYSTLLGLSTKFIPVFIGTDFMGIMDNTLFDVEYPMIRVIGDFEDGSVLTSYVHISGNTVSFDIDDGESTHFEFDGLIATIYSEGDYRAYTNPTDAKILYSAIGYDSYGDTDEYYLNANFNGTSATWAIGGHYHYDSFFELNPQSVTAEYVKEGKMTTGMSVSGTFNGGGSINETIPFGLVDEYSDEESIYAIGFAIGQDNNSGGGSADIPDSLATMVSAIPLIMTIGLISTAFVLLRRS